jgi:hypothetical protein
MKALMALLRGTWWLWLLFVVASVVLSELVDPVFWVMLPICAVTIVYFAFVRYDEHGNRRESD